MALRAALALADVCTMNFLVITFYEVVTKGIDIDGVHVHVKGKFYERRNSVWFWFGPFPRHNFTTAFRDETYDELISLGCSRYDHVLKPGGLVFTEGSRYQLSILRAGLVNQSQEFDYLFLSCTQVPLYSEKGSEHSIKFLHLQVLYIK